MVFLSWAKISLKLYVYSVCLCLCTSAVEFLELKILWLNRLQITSRMKSSYLTVCVDWNKFGGPYPHVVHTLEFYQHPVLWFVEARHFISPEWCICQYSYQHLCTFRLESIKYFSNNSFKCAPVHGSTELVLQWSEEPSNNLDRLKNPSSKRMELWTTGH